MFVPMPASSYKWVPQLMEVEQEDEGGVLSLSPSSAAPSIVEGTQLALDNAATFGLVFGSYQSRFEEMQQIIDEGLTLSNQAAPSRERRYAHWPELEHARVCWLTITLRLWHEYIADLPVETYGPTGFNFYTMKLSREVSAFVDPPRFKMILATRSVIVGYAPPIRPTASA